MNVIKKIISFALVIGWMAVVFAFSAQSADASSEASGGITKNVVKFLVKEPDKMPTEQRDIVETVVRKTAHFLLYLVGGFLIANFMNTFNITNKNKLIFIILFVTIYACTDEIHQYFVDGRSCEFRDVIIDSLGGCTGTGLFLCMKKMMKKLKGK